MTTRTARIDMPMPIETPRLMIRSIMPGDGPAMTAAKLETLDRLNPWLPFAARTPTVDDDEKTAKTFYEKFLAREDFMLIGYEKGSNIPVVWAGLHPLNWRERVFSSGYWVRKSAHGKRYAIEVNNALIRYAFNALNASRMEISHAEGNVASESVIRRLGYIYERTYENASMLTNGKAANTLTYVRTNLDGLPPLDVKWRPT